MIYVQYFHYGTTGKLIPACGDRSVVVLDGRQKLHTWLQDAKNFNGWRRPVYPAFQLWRGRSFTQSQPLTKVLPL